MTENPPPVDGITPVLSQEDKNHLNPAVPVELRKRMKAAISIFVIIPYALYVLWCLYLLIRLPDPEGAAQQLTQAGLLSSAAGGLLLLLILLLSSLRIFEVKDLPLRVRLFSVVRALLVFLPGVALSGYVPLTITKEPALSLEIVSPPLNQLVAPVAVTFSAERATEILSRRGLRVTGYLWDFNADQKPDEESVLPEATGIFERDQSYDVIVVLRLSNGQQRTVGYRLVIQEAVFSVAPIRPVVDEPVKFSIRHLVDAPSDVQQVQWDFDDDGNPDQTTQQGMLDVVHTFLRTGPQRVTVIVELPNVQHRYERVVDIMEPEPLPFPVTLITEPERLISPAPFGTFFQIQTTEPVRDVVWDFGDGEKATGTRVGHTFREMGNFAVTAEVRSQTGTIARLTKLVQVVERLALPDLVYDGEPEVRNNALSGEVPVEVNLTPKTSMPLVSFYWEAPEASVVGSTDTNLQAIYRRPGTYTITLLAEDPDGRALRQPLKLTVNPPTSVVSVAMNPESGAAPLLVRFDASETVIPGEEITGFEWTFALGDEMSTKQGGAQEQYLFEKAGTYKITVRAYTTRGTPYETTKTLVVAAPVLDACFLPSRTRVQLFGGVTFDMGCTTGAIGAVEWDFGDGGRSDERNPTHIFEQRGTFNVTLSVSGPSGTTSKETVTITVQ